MCVSVSFIIEDKNLNLSTFEPGTGKERVKCRAQVILKISSKKIKEGNITSWVREIDCEG